MPNMSSKRCSGAIGIDRDRDPRLQTLGHLADQAPVERRDFKDIGAAVQVENPPVAGRLAARPHLVDRASGDVLARDVDTLCHRRRRAMILDRPRALDPAVHLRRAGEGLLAGVAQIG
jgi:hypothetical protein